MNEAPPFKQEWHCSFCGKSQHVVKKLIAGPNVFICDECVLVCLGVMIDRQQVANIFSIKSASPEAA